MARFARQAQAGVSRRSGAPNAPSGRLGQRGALRRSRLAGRFPEPAAFTRAFQRCRGLAERVAVTAESRVAPSWDASSSHAPVTGADRGGAMLLSSTGGDRLSDRSSDKPAAPADDSTLGSSPSDTLSDKPAVPCGKPCGRPAAGDDTSTGSSRTRPSPDRRPLHLTTIPARRPAEERVAVPPGQKPRQRATQQREGWVRLPSRRG